MASGIFRRRFIPPRRQRRLAVATFTRRVSTLPLARRRAPEIYRRRPLRTWGPRRIIAGLPNADAKIAPPFAARPPPHSVYRRPYPPPPSQRRRLALATLTVAAAAPTTSLPLPRRIIPEAVYRRLRPHVTPRRVALATLTLPAAAPTTSLPIPRRRPPQTVYRRKRPLRPRPRAVATLTKRVVSMPLPRRVAPAWLWRKPRPLIFLRGRRALVGLPDADAVITTSLPLPRRALPYTVWRRAPPIIFLLGRRGLVGLPNADAVAPPPSAGKGRRPRRLSIAPRPPLPPPPILLPSVVTPPVGVIRMRGLTPMVVSGPVETVLTFACLSLRGHAPFDLVAGMHIGLAAAPEGSRCGFPLRIDAPTQTLRPMSGLSRSELTTIIQDEMESIALLGFSDRAPLE